MRLPYYVTSIVLFLFIFANGSEDIIVREVQIPASEIDICFVLNKDIDTSHYAVTMNIEMLDSYKGEGPIVVSEDDIVLFQSEALVREFEEYRLFLQPVQFEQKGEVIQLDGGPAIKIPASYNCLLVLLYFHNPSVKEDNSLDDLLVEIYNPDSQPLQQKMSKSQIFMLRCAAWCFEKGIDLKLFLAALWHRFAGLE